MFQLFNFLFKKFEMKLHVSVFYHFLWQQFVHLQAFPKSVPIQFFVATAVGIVVAHVAVVGGKNEGKIEKKRVGCLMSKTLMSKRKLLLYMYVNRFQRVVIKVDRQLALNVDRFDRGSLMLKRELSLYVDSFGQGAFMLKHKLLLYVDRFQRGGY